MGVLQKLAAMELTGERLVDLAAGKIEAARIAKGREAYDLELIGYRSHLPFGRFRLE